MINKDKTQLNPVYYYVKPCVSSKGNSILVLLYAGIREIYSNNHGKSPNGLAKRITFFFLKIISMIKLQFHNLYHNNLLSLSVSEKSIAGSRLED